MIHKGCQVQDMATHLDRPKGIPMFLQRMRKLVFLSAAKRASFACKWIFMRSRNKLAPQAEKLKPGDRVMVKSRGEIEAMLDPGGRLGKLKFDDCMWEFCSTEQRVFKNVQFFMDEGRWTLMKAKNCVLLENCFCDGKLPHGQCDRNCLSFWRTEWLKKID